MKFELTNIKDRVKKLTVNHLAWLDRSGVVNDSRRLILNLEAALTGEQEYNFDDLKLEKLMLNQEFKIYVGNLLNNYRDEFTEQHPLLRYALINRLDLDFPHLFLWAITDRLCNAKDQSFIEFLIENKFEEEYLFDKAISSRSHIFMKTDRKGGFTMMPFGAFMADKMQVKKSFLGLRKSLDFGAKMLDSVLTADQHRMSEINQYVIYLDQTVPDLVKPHLSKFILNFKAARYVNYGQVTINVELIEYLLLKDYDTYRKMLEDIVSINKPREINTLMIYALIAKHEDEAISDLFDALIVEYMDGCIGNDPRHRNDLTSWDTNVLEVYLERMFEYNRPLFDQRLMYYCANAYYVSYLKIKYIETKLGADGIGYIGAMFSQQRANLAEYILKNIFEYLEKYDYTSIQKEIIGYALNHSAKAEKKLICSLLASTDIVIDEGLRLLIEKKVDQRITGALLLANVKDHVRQDAINTALVTAIDKESNDETRNIMLDAVADQRFAQAYTRDRVDEMIEKAGKRKKTQKWKEKHIQEENVPALYWTDGDKLSEIDIRFLLYRMSLVKRVESDIEARQMLQYIDRERTDKFALFLLQAFIDSNSDSKIKHYLTVVGLIGGDKLLSKLETLFRKSIADKRVKMAEYVLGAIAMIGSDKSLRVIEVISRKYANKKPKLSQVALGALDAAAKELNITKDQLADRIIPNFGFEGTFKSFDAGGEEYRAFINKEFKLVYLNESNKLRKSAPPATAPELKKEFKTIGNEIRNVVKSQSDRLERYMIFERSWEADNWREFFFQNPIMFVYALHLLWITRDEYGAIKQMFYCDEDGDMYDLEDEEVTLEDNDKVGIMHPASLSVEQLAAWKQKAFDLGLKTIFPILERPVFSKYEDELDAYATRRFANTEIPKGADFVAPQMLKRGYLKENGDGGSLNFYRIHKPANVLVMPYIEGPAAYYQNGEVEAHIHEISFSEVGGRVKKKISEVPDVFFSEIMADMTFLIEAQ